MFGHSAWWLRTDQILPLSQVPLCAFHRHDHASPTEAATILPVLRGQPGKRPQRFPRPQAEDITDATLSKNTKVVTRCSERVGTTSDLATRTSVISDHKLWRRSS